MKTIPSGLLEKVVDRLKAEFQPDEIYLFGSRAWGAPTDDSDVDLMIICPRQYGKDLPADATGAPLFEWFGFFQGRARSHARSS